MNSFTSMIGHLSSVPVKPLSKMRKTVTRVEYDIFCKEFIFDKLKEMTFGEAFCKRFDIVDNVLVRISDEGAKFLIEKLGYIEE